MDIKERLREQIQNNLGDESYQLIEEFANALTTGYVFAPVRIGPREEVYITIMGPGLEPKFIDVLVDEPEMTMRLINTTQEKYGNVNAAFVTKNQEQFNTALLARHALKNKAKEKGMTLDEFHHHCIELVEGSITDDMKRVMDAIPD